RMKEDRDRIKESIDNLDRNMFVVRKFHSQEGWASKNIYIPFEVEPDVEDSTEKIVLRFLKGYGPSSLQGIRGGTSFYYSEIEAVLSKLREEGVVEKIWMGDLGLEMWILTEELEKLENIEPREVRDRLRILSLYDPWIQPMWSQLISKFGEGWYFPIIKNGDICGMIEKWEMSGCLEIREVMLESEELLPELIDELDRMMKFYRKKGLEILRIKRAFGEDIAGSKHLETFLKKGYKQIGDFIAKGKFEPLVFTRNQVLSYIFWKQGIHDEHRFENVMDAIDALGGLRSDYEANLKTDIPVSLQRLMDQGTLFSGRTIPEFVTYSTLENIAVYKKAKNRRLTEYMKMVLDVIKDKEPIRRKQLFTLSPLGYGNTTEALRRLSDGLYVVWEIIDGKGAYRSVPDIPDLTTNRARKTVLKRIMDSYGIFSAENLSAYTKHEFKMEETRKTLRQLEREGHLVKGFFVEDEETLYWALKEDLDKIAKMTFDKQFLLTPRDNLSIYLRERVRERWNMGSAAVAFDGTDMIAALRVRWRKNEMIITDFKGDLSAREILKTFSLENDIRVVEEREQMDDWEMVIWYERMRGKESK
ncbi:MAG: winged helix DNA-binding domain-containing protein, partial [Methanobacteriota archaeon]